MEDCISRTTGGGNTGNSVFKGLTGENILWTDVGTEKSHDEVAAADSDFIVARIGRWCTRRSQRRQTDKLHHGCHGVGGVLTATRAGARTGVVFDLFEVRVAHTPGCMG